MNLDEVTARMAAVRTERNDLDAQISALKARRLALAAEYETLYTEANALYRAQLDDAREEADR